MSINRSTLLEHVSSPSWPLSAKDWNRDIHANCLAFAFGLPIDTPNEIDFDEPACISGKYQYESIFIAIIDVCIALGLQFRKLETPNHAADDEYIIAGWGFFPYKVFGCTRYDFHFVRRDLDGKWYHKPGWKKPPCEIVDWDAELEEWLEEGEPVYFAIKKEAP